MQILHIELHKKYITLHLEWSKKCHRLLRDIDFMLSPRLALPGLLFSLGGMSLLVSQMLRS